MVMMMKWIQSRIFSLISGVSFLRRSLRYWESNGSLKQLTWKSE